MPAPQRHLRRRSVATLQRRRRPTRNQPGRTVPGQHGSRTAVNDSRLHHRSVRHTQTRMNLPLRNSGGSGRIVTRKRKELFRPGEQGISEPRTAVAGPGTGGLRRQLRSGPLRQIHVRHRTPARRRSARSRRARPRSLRRGRLPSTGWRSRFQRSDPRGLDSGQRASIFA